jgi:crossover junction endodeoxyribonuclease RusA
LSHSYTFFAKGKPAPQGSKKVHRYVQGRAILGESSVNVQPWRAIVSGSARRLRPQEWHATLPMSLVITFVFARPKSHFRTNGELKDKAPRYCTTRIGDLDKLCRAVCDSLTGIAYDDDSQVCHLQAERRYATNNEPPGALITITTFNV